MDGPEILARLREVQREVAPAVEAMKKKKRLQKTFKRGQSVTVPPSTEPTIISVTKGKAHLSFSGTVEWGRKTAGG